MTPTTPETAVPATTDPAAAPERSAGSVVDDVVDRVAAEMLAPTPAPAEPAPAEPTPAPAPDAPAEPAVAKLDDTALMELATRRAELRRLKADGDRQVKEAKAAALAELRESFARDPNSILEALGDPSAFERLTLAQLGVQKQPSQEDVLRSMQEQIAGLQREIRERDVAAKRSESASVIEKEKANLAATIAAEAERFPFINGFQSKGQDLVGEVWNRAVRYYAEHGEAPPSYQSIADQVEKELRSRFADVIDWKRKPAAAQTTTPTVGRGTAPVTHAPPPAQSRRLTTDEAIESALAAFGIN